MNIVDTIFAANSKRPEQIAIKDEFGVLSYEEFEDAVKHVAITLKDLGLKKGMGVGIMDRNSRHFIIAVFAVLKLEAVAMPISNQLKSQELNQILSNSGLNYLLDAGNGPETDAKMIAEFSINESNWTLNVFKEFNGEGFANHVNDPAIIRYTSGTTGLAKGVIIGHQSINERIDGANKILELGVKDTVIWVLPMSYHFVVSIILYLKYGVSIAIAKDFLGSSIFACIKENEGTFLYASPMHIKLLTNYKSEETLDTLNTVISTSTAISKAQCDAFYEEYKIPVSQAYGIIEIGLPMINSNKAAEHPDAVGHALPDYEVGILSDDFKKLPSGEIGNLGIKGPGMFDAYLAPPTLRSDILSDGWFMTGDLASMDLSGLVKVEGRKKSMINVSGNKVFPVEVEQILNSHPRIQISRVSGFTHRLMGEMVRAEIVLTEGEPIDKESIITYCRQRLTTYKVPQKIKFLEDLPMTDSGKLKR